MVRSARPIEYDYVDDFDGTPLQEGTEVTEFSVAGVRYEIDLSDANVKKLNEALDTVQAFINSARLVSPLRRSGRATKAAAEVATGQA